MVSFHSTFNSWRMGLIIELVAFSSSYRGKSTVISLLMGCQTSCRSILYSIVSKDAFKKIFSKELTLFVPCIIHCLCRFQACFSFGTTEQSRPCSREKATKTTQVIWGALQLVNFWKTPLVEGDFDQLLVNKGSPCAVWELNYSWVIELLQSPPLCCHS